MDGVSISYKKILGGMGVICKSEWLTQSMPEALRAYTPIGYDMVRGGASNSGCLFKMNKAEFDSLSKSKEFLTQFLAGRYLINTKRLKNN